MAATGFTLRVEFLGVCAFVPDQPFFEEQEDGTYKAGAPTRVDVLVPDLKAPALASWETDPTAADLHLRGSHWPVLMYDAGSVATTDVAPSFRFIDPDFGRLRFAHILAQQQLSFNIQTPPPFSVENTVPASAELPFPDPKTAPTSSLWWMPQMVEISPQHAFARNDLLTAKIPEELAARVEITMGHLSVASLNRAAHIAWGFEEVRRDAAGQLEYPSQPTWNRAIGNRLVLECQVAVGDVTILLKDAGSSDQIVLKPTAEGGVLTITIANAEPEMLLAGIDPNLIPKESRADPDFDAVYTLAAFQGGARPVPVKPDGNIGDKEKPCAPVAFQGRSGGA